MTVIKEGNYGPGKDSVVGKILAQADNNGKDKLPLQKLPKLLREGHLVRIVVDGKPRAVARYPYQAAVDSVSEIDNKGGVVYQKDFTDLPSEAKRQEMVNERTGILKDFFGSVNRR